MHSPLTQPTASLLQLIEQFVDADATHLNLLADER